MNKIFYFFISFLILLSCNHKKELQKKKIAFVNQSYANIDSIQITKAQLNLEIDFETKKIGGSVTYDIEAKTNYISLDIKDLTIHEILNEKGKQLSFITTNPDTLHEALLVSIPKGKSKITIYYESQKDRGLQWLNKEQTSNGSNPFAYTANDYIFTRNWIPITDNPSFRFPYEAVITTKHPFTAIMSANLVKKNQHNNMVSYVFNQPKPISPNQICLVVGVLNTISLSDKVKLYAEPNQIEKAAEAYHFINDFHDKIDSLNTLTEKSVTNFVVMPFSFPSSCKHYSQLALIENKIRDNEHNRKEQIIDYYAEIIGGNKISNKTWDDIWIPLAYTNYKKRQLILKIIGKKAFYLSEYKGKLNYNTTMYELVNKNNMKELSLYLKTEAPHNRKIDFIKEKGYLFFKMLENKYGSNTCDSILQILEKKQENQPINSKELIAFLNDKLVHKDPSISLHTWVYSADEPINIPKFTPMKFSFNNYSHLNNKNLNSLHDLELIYYMNTLFSMSKEKFIQKDKQIHFNQIQSPYAFLAWAELALSQEDKTALPYLKEFVSNNGNMDNLQLAYFILLEKGYRKEANEYYNEFKNKYHKETQQKIEKTIKLLP